MSKTSIIQPETDAGSASFQGRRTWKEVVSHYQRPAAWRGIWQMLNTLVPYAALWYLMYFSLGISQWLTVPLALLAGGFLVRIFIIFHDCSHGSFFKSRIANDVVGFITGLFTFTASTLAMGTRHPPCKCRPSG